MPEERVIWGPPGTGKTTASITLANTWLDRGTPSDGIAFVAFTKAAAKAAATKIFQTEDEARMTEEFPYFRTVHSLCYRALKKERPDLRLINTADMKQFAKLYSMDGVYAIQPWEDLADVYAGLKDGGRSEWDQALNAYAFTRIKARNPEELDQARQEPSPEGAMMLGFDSMSMQVYKAFIEKYEKFKREDGLIDFTDMLEFGMRDMKPLHDVKYVIADESQDLAPCHYGIIDRIFSSAKELWWVGDDDQCLPGDELVLTEFGYRRISSIAVGENVVSGHGIGETGNYKVTKKSERSYTGEILKVTTESGRSFRCTPEHKVFCRWEENSEKWIVYLMKQGDFFRLGISKIGTRRMALERNVDGMMPVSVFDTEIDARVCEATLSLRFGIPTCLFPYTTARANVLPPEARKKIYESCNSSKAATDILEFYSKSWEPIYKKGVERGHSSRKMVNIYPFSFRVRGGTSIPMITYENGGSRALCREKRFRKSFRDLKDAYQWLEKNPLEGSVFERWNFVSNQHCYRIQARNLLPGISKVPCVQDGRVVMERVASVERSQFSGLVYDLEVDKAHNFSANGVFVSNCIFKFSGASAELFLERAKRSRYQIQLRQTHRFGQSIVDFSSKIIERVKNRHQKEVIGVEGRDGEIKISGSFEPIPGDIMILHRHVQGCQSVAQAYMDAGLPFRNERGRDPLDSPKRIRAWQTVRALSQGDEVTLSAAAVVIEELLPSVIMGSDLRKTRLVVHGRKSALEEAGRGTVDLRSLITGRILTEEGAAVIRDRDWQTMKHHQDLDYYDRVTKNGYDVENLEKIPRITTIHGAKGRQAGQTVVFCEMGNRCWDDHETEHRLAYVAATRTQTDVTICMESKVHWAEASYEYPVQSEETEPRNA